MKNQVMFNILKDILADGAHNIVFMKADESFRPMRCTRDIAIIEEFIGPVDMSANTPAVNTETIKVFDVQAEAWRSFRIDRLVSVNGIPASEIHVLIGLK